MRYVTGGVTTSAVEPTDTPHYLHLTVDGGAADLGPAAAVELARELVDWAQRKTFSGALFLALLYLDAFKVE